MAKACIFYRYGCHFVCIDCSVADLDRLLSDLEDDFEIVIDNSKQNQAKYYVNKGNGDYDLIGIIFTEC